MITFIELIKNPSYKFWEHEFVHCAPEIQKLFESVARSCMVSIKQEMGLLLMSYCLSREPNIFIDADLRISVFSHQVLTPMSSAAAAAQQANVVDGTQRIDTTEQK